MSEILRFTKEQKATLTTTRNGKFLTGNLTESNRTFAVEISSDKIFLCGKEMQKAMKTGLYLVEGEWSANDTRYLPDELALVESQLQLSNIHAYTERKELAREQLRLKCQVEAARKQIMSGQVANVDSALVGLPEGIHVERAGQVAYLHQCARVPVVITRLEFCTEEVPVKLGAGNQSTI